MNQITVEGAELLHARLLERYGGEPGIRDAGLLNMAIMQPFQTSGGRNLYESIEAKAAVLIRGLIKNHPFVDGNKRVGMLAGLAFLEMNGRKIVAKPGEIERAGVAVASGKMDRNAIEAWIIENTSKRDLAR